MSFRSAENACKTGFQKLGLLLAVIFYLVSVFMVIRNHGGMDAVFSGDTQVLTFAHWQLEDGFREGFEEAIRVYEQKKLEQGIKVRVRQVAIPIRGYPQWFLTQLIGGEPADVMEMTGGADLQNQYFHALSPYIGTPNPWNRGTPLENMSWRESFTDDMLSALNTAYSDFFSVCIFMHTTRVYVNLELYEKATGTTKTPETVTEWLDACRKLHEYGKKNKRPIIPIGVRGFDKLTLGQLIANYNSQLNAGYAEIGSDYGYGYSYGKVFELVNSGKLAKDRLLEPIELVVELGQYFAKGFPSIDVEQTKYLFSSGNVGFFIDGTWNAYGLIANSPFPVKVIRIPELDKGHRLGARSHGRVTELGSGVGGKFGIPKRTKHFELALDFLQFITSYEINQMTMVKHCKWMSSLKDVTYEGVMKDFEPVADTRYTAILNPLNTGTYSNRRMLQRTENLIIRNSGDSKREFWQDYLKDRKLIIEELRESNHGIQRNIWNMDATRSAFAVGAFLPGFSDARKKLAATRNSINIEGMLSRIRAINANTELMREIARLKEYDENGD